MGLITGMDYRNGHLYVSLSIFHFVFEDRLGQKIKYCLFVLYLPTHILPPYPKNYIAILYDKIFLFLLWQTLDNLPGLAQEMQFLSNIV